MVKIFINKRDTLFYLQQLRWGNGFVCPKYDSIGKACLDEFVFRFKRRTSGSRGMLFYRLLQQAVVATPVTYQDAIQSPAMVAQPKEAL